MTLTRSHPLRATALAVVAALMMLGPAYAQVPMPNLPDRLAVAVPFQPVATVFAEDFELGDGGFVATGNASWQHGTPSVHVTPAVGQGPNMWATNLHGPYGDIVCGAVQSPPIDLAAYPPGAQTDTGVSAARLAFRHWMHTEKAWDGGIVQASADGVNWVALTPTAGYDDRQISSLVRTCLGTVIGEGTFTGPSSSTPPAGDDWRIREFDVTPFLGGQLHLRWVFGSDTSATRLGWYFDDVLVQVGAGGFVSAPLPEVDPSAGVAFTPAATLYAEDFEATDGGWTESGTGAWAWGEPAAPPLPPSGSLNVWGTRLAGEYLPSECSYLVSPAIDLPAANAGAGVEVARLSFQLWRHLRSGYDGAAVQVSTDGGATWNHVTPLDGYDRTISLSAAEPVRDCLGLDASARVWSGPFSEPKAEEWMDVDVDLTPFLGNTILVRFAMGSGSSGVVYRGAYVSDVLVQVGAGGSVDASEPPQVELPSTWSAQGDASWAHGVPTTGPASRTPVWATNLHGNYGADECGAIVSQPVDTNAIAGLGRLTLSFEHWMESATSYDGGVVQVSNDDGATWTTVTPYNGYSTTLSSTARACLAPGATTLKGYAYTPTGSDYRAEEANLASFQGDTIRVRFAFASSPTLHDLGWYVRGVALDRGAGDVPLAMTPGVLLGEVPTALAQKADAALLRALANGETESIEVIVQGPLHENVAELGFATRGEYARWFDAQAAPFLEGVRTQAEASGATVTAEWSMLPAIKLVADLPTLALLAARDDVQTLTKDSDDSVHLIDPVEGGSDVREDGVGAQNTEGRQMLQAEEMWALGFMGEGVKVVIIDTGIDGTHEAFKHANGSSRIAAWADFVNDRPTPYDDQGHGTHVTATSMGSDLYDDPTWGRFTQVGVAPRATIMGAKFLSSSGSGSFQGAIDSLDWAFAQGADITSNSWGASGCGSSAHPVMAAVRTTTDAGMLNVFAAGNSGPGSGTIGSPACSESALSVGAVDKNGNIASFSSRGPCADTETGGPSRICPDVVAKGYLVVSAAPRGSCSLCAPSGYKVLNGTSMATPHVSGAVALAEQMKRHYTGSGWDTAARAEEEVFKITAADLGAAGEDNTYGWGLPQLTAIQGLLTSTDEARIISSFGVSRDVVRQGDATTLRFEVRNLGGVSAAGTFRATLTDPAGATSVLKEADIALHLLDRESYSSAFVVTGDVAPGTYTFAGTFAYTYTDANGTVQERLIDHSASFDVKRVFVSVAIEGLDARTLPLDAQEVTYTATNTGNENASAMRIEFTVPDDYVFLPGDNYDPNDATTRYADPAPGGVREDKSFGRVTLTFDVGELPVGESFSFTTRLLPTTPGEYRLISVAKFSDGGGNVFAQGAAASQTVAVP